MSELTSIKQVVARAMARRRLHHAWKGLWTGLAVGAGLYLVALLVFKLAPIPPAILGWAGLLALVAIPVGFLAGWLRPVSEAQTARWLDQSQDLKERLSTALEVASKPVDPRWQQLVIADATQAAATVDPKRLIPWNLPKLSRVCLVTLAAVVGLGFVPEYRTTAHLQKQKDKAVIQEAGKQLANLTRRSLQAKKPVLEKTEKSLENVSELGERLQSAQLTRGDALKDIASAAEKLKQDLGEMSKNPAMRRMEQAARTPSGMTTPSAQALQKQIDRFRRPWETRRPRTRMRRNNCRRICRH